MKQTNSLRRSGHGPSSTSNSSSVIFNSSSEIELNPPPPKSVSLRTSNSNQLPRDSFHFDSPKLRQLRKRHAKLATKIPKQRKEHEGRLTVVLDLDETLVHSKISPRSQLRAAQDMFDCETDFEDPNLESFQLNLQDGESVRVFKRPGLDQFLQSSSRKYELIVFTAGLSCYADPLLNWLDPEGTLFSHRLYRDSCHFVGGYYVKDLHVLQRDLQRTVLVDNNLCCFLPQLCNGIPISSFFDDPNDDALNVLANYLEGIEAESDVRTVLSRSFNLPESLQATRNSVLG